MNRLAGILFLVSTASGLWSALGSASAPVSPGASESRSPDTLRATRIPHERFADARAVAADPLGALYVADAGRHVVIKLTAAGATLATVGGPGSADGQFDRPIDVDPTNGLVLLVADAGNGRIQLFSRSLAFLGAMPLSREIEGEQAAITYRRTDAPSRREAEGTPIAVTSSGSNETYALDGDRRLVIRWNENRRATAVFGGLDAGRGALGDPVDLWAGPNSLIYVADRTAGPLLVFDQHGSFVRRIGSADRRDVRAVAGNGNQVFLLLADELRAYSLEGRLVQTWKFDLELEPVDLAVDPQGRMFILSSSDLFELHP